ncbi:class I SAM-dependent methyltransferase [Actinoplanes sp. NPDC026619]|uniref:class I SAM-dependent methyltransferase n=1 Tax=Actinoplanes sp. NPDC026619 TaxID=3155798 RepID=UPI0033C06948
MVRYRTWLRPGRLYPIVVLTALSLAGCALGVLNRWFLLFLLPLSAFGYVSVILLGSAYRLGPGGAQRRIHELIASQVPGGRVLDIGCGSGSLAITIARRCPDATVTGIDSWGPGWHYSRQLCEENARVSGVTVRFERGSGAALDFPDAAFDVVVSCMTFHEIRDKADCVREALRVLRPGGRFVFVDPFADPAYYPTPPRLPGSSCPLGDLVDLPFPLRHPKVLGRVLLLAGLREH